LTTDDTRPINKCQYWSIHEPLQCIHWDEESTVCSFAENKIKEAAESGETIGLSDISLPNKAPYCNLIGTHLGCTHYESSSPGSKKPRCILPDPERHICNRETGKKWVYSEGNVTDEETGEKSSLEFSGYDLLEFSFDEINGYNGGMCDGAGTDTTCSGYSPYHMGFGRLVASSDTDFTTPPGVFSPISDFELKLPFNFVIYNIRAILSKCKWWEDSYSPFVVNDEGMVTLSSSWTCFNPEDKSVHSEFTEEFGAPCNGCKPECDGYTGICWQYCIDKYMRDGDPILAEHVHEIRYYFRENNWKKEQIEKYFADEGNIYSWHGGYTEGGTESEDGEEDKKYVQLKGDISLTYGADGFVKEYEIPSYRTYMDNFDFFNVESEFLILSEGTKVDDKLNNFPTLVRQLEILSLDPIIKNRFDANRVLTYSDDEGNMSFFDGDPIFESNLLGHANMMVYGKVFYEEPVFAINISDKEIYSVMPKLIYNYDCMLDIRIDLGEKNFSKFYSLFSNIIELLKKIKPEKVVSDILPKTNSSFITEVPILYSNDTYSGLNENIIMVFQESPDGIVFSKLKFYREFVGGILIQNEFKIEGELDKKTNQPKDYTKDFMAQVNKNGIISFKFSPFVSDHFYPKVSYFYNDLYMPKEYSPTQVQPEITTLYVGSKLYKITKEIYIITLAEGPDEVELYQLGSDGYMLINLLDTRINSVVKPWEVETIEAVGEDNFEFEIVYHGSEGKLAPNQAIIRPKDPSNFKSICHGGGAIVLKNLSYYEKRSYDESPDIVDYLPWHGWDSYEVIEDENYNYSYVDVGELENTYSDATYNFVIRNFKFTMVPSVVIQGRSGRNFTQYRTKPIGWCKQPYCQDVEIKYKWKANYTEWENHSDKGVCNCCGGYYQKNPSSRVFYQDPPCGDHDIFSVTKTGPMWWPYTMCESYETYNIVNNLDNYSVDTIGLFKYVGFNGDKAHGDHDMRMLGPETKIAYHGYGCNFLIKCTCDWRTYNAYKSGENIFVGWSRIRGFVSDTELAMMENEGEVLPKFGNFNRPNMLSYRTTDSWQYIYSYDGVEWFVGWMIMPSYASFTKIDFTLNDNDVMWNYGADQYGTPVVNPLGLYLCSDMDGYPTNEVIDYNNRLRFEQVFNCKFCIDGIRYPNTTGDYVKTKKQGKIYPWYEFKKYPVVFLGEGFDPNDPNSYSINDGGGGYGDRYIQWAWQEIWKPIYRNYGVSIYSFINEVITKSEDPFYNVKGPFFGEGGNNVGVLSIINIEYPEYKYDFKNEEHRLVIKEGQHEINFHAPEKDTATGEYDGYMAISIDSGPMRGISWEGQWLSTSNQDVDGSYNISLYDECIGDAGLPLYNANYGVITKWSDEVTLFAEEWSENPSDDRLIKYYHINNDEEYEVREYFNRGLKVTLNASSMVGGTLPTEKILTSPELVFGDLDITYVCGVTEYEYLGYLFPEEGKKTITSVEISFSFGAKFIDETEKQTEVYHIPQISVFRSSDGVEQGELLYETNGVEFYKQDGNSIDFNIKKITLDWDNSLEYIGEGDNGVVIGFRVTPTDEEISSLTLSEKESYDKNINFIEPTVIDIFEEVLVNATEYIYTWERKYYVSHANVENPPQGKDEDSNTFAPRTNHKSTVWQRDTNEGVYGVEGSENPMKMQSKTFSRFVYEITEDKTPLGGSVNKMENKQKELYDKAISEDMYDSMMNHIVPPGMSELLNDAMIYYRPINNLYLHNSLLNELSDINHFGRMNGEGYLYLPGEPNNSKCTRSYCEGTAPPAWLYNFVAQDPNADSRYSGRGYSSPFISFYGGTAAMTQRLHFAEVVRSNVFGPLYGMSTENKIWKEPEKNSEMIFYDLQCLYSSVSLPPPIHWNSQYFAISMNWHNAYFNTQKYFNIDSEEINM
jgi:hypothetical protein